MLHAPVQHISYKTRVASNKNLPFKESACFKGQTEVHRDVKSRPFCGSLLFKVCIPSSLDQDREEDERSGGTACKLGWKLVT